MEGSVRGRSRREFLKYAGGSAMAVAVLPVLRKGEEAGGATGPAVPKVLKPVVRMGINAIEEGKAVKEKGLVGAVIDHARHMRKPTKKEGLLLVTAVLVGAGALSGAVKKVRMGIDMVATYLWDRRGRKTGN